ncbi:transporter substrate-binding domain-containing protein [Pseudomonas fulva]|uniref:transporter substrate-binding domain-containing protein n=1 Tax=Pseudomonas fulva TaxID=47880 RepID=UPI0018A918FC|nr:transporter substrate-binding domain-containing protein [Pseudomonas fulva]MBF8775001.1 transporter substrate-binding domain-containing protein [Pseudomonas fulva]
MKRVVAGTLLLMMLAGAVAQSLASETRSLLARSVSATQPLNLQPAERQWLDARKHLVLGTSRPDYPPFDINVSLNDYEGLTADYIGIIGELLGIAVEVKRFDSRYQAIEALHEGRVDVLGSSNSFEAADAGLSLSTAYADDLPVIVTREDQRLGPAHDLAGLRLAMVDHYLPANRARALYPAAQLMLYRSTQAGLAAVAMGEADAYLGDAISTDYLIGKTFRGALRIDHFSPIVPEAFAFAVARDNDALRQLLDKALRRIGESERLAILKRWSNSNTSLLLQRHLSALTDEEQAWIKAHPVVDVLINPTLAPLTFYDDQQRPSGITLDLLKQISLRTGLHFHFRQAESAQSMIDRLGQRDAMMIGALGYGAERAKQVRYTRPYLISPRVLVTRVDNPPQAGINRIQPQRIALIRNSPQRAMLQQRYPQARLVEVDNPLDLMEAVVNRTADAALSSHINAAYYISHVFKNRLQIASILDEDPAVAAFAIAADQPQLQSILDKSLLSMAPEELEQLINRWRTSSVVSDSPWRNYRELALQVLVIAALLIAGVVFWNSYLRKLIQRRVEAERALQTQLALSRGLLEQLRHAKDEAEQASLMKSTFLATMSHEIRTPMNAVLGLLELALVDSRAGRCDTHMLETAHESALGLLALIGDILDISRIESGHISLQPVPTDLVDLVRATLRVFEGNARVKGLELACDLPTEPVWVQVDAARLKQVLSNLISNAIKFTDRGEVHTAMHTSVQGELQRVELCVRDSGIGISTADQARLFNAFVQVDGPRARQGTGLGLAISRALTELMGGTLTLQSVEGVGTRVQIVVALPPCTPQIRSDEKAPTTDLDACPLNILVVDDYPANLLLLERQLRALGHQVTQAQNGEIALQLWHETHFDVVITDCSMPVMDGHALACRIRAQEHQQGLSPTTILGVTANAQAEERERCLASGMNDCLFKPIGLHGLKAHLPQATGKPPAAPAPASARPGGLNLAELRHLTRDDGDLIRHLIEQLSQSVAEDLATLRTLDGQAPDGALKALAHRIKGGAKMLKVRDLVADCEALEQALVAGDPVDDLRRILQETLQTLLKDLAATLETMPKPPEPD